MPSAGQGGPRLGERGAEWASQADDAPSESARRGLLAAGAILSGLDYWWGLRDDPDATVGVELAGAPQV